MLNVVMFNGGRGAAGIIRHIVAHDGLHLTSIVNAYDDGKSTGEIRRLFHMLGPSDIRKVQQVMIPRNLPSHDEIQRLFEFRYPADSCRNDCLEQFDMFAKGSTHTIGNCTVRDESIRRWLRVFAGSFRDNLMLLEKASATEFSFADCSMMNCIYAGAFQFFNRDFELATLSFNKLLRLKGTVLPTNTEDKKLVAIRENGDVLYNEAEIVELRSNARIRDIYILDQYPERGRLECMTIDERARCLNALKSHVRATDHVLRALRSADVIVFAAGTQHSSLYPSYLTRGIPEAIAENTAAVKIFVCNIGEDYETPQYVASEYIRGAFQYLTRHATVHLRMGDVFDHALVNTTFSSGTEQYVRVDNAELDALGINVVCEGYEDELCPGKHSGAQILDAVLRLYEDSLTKQIWKRK